MPVEFPKGSLDSQHNVIPPVDIGTPGGKQQTRTLVPRREDFLRDLVVQSGLSGLGHIRIVIHFFHIIYIYIYIIFYIILYIILYYILYYIYIIFILYILYIYYIIYITYYIYYLFIYLFIYLKIGYKLWTNWGKKWFRLGGKCNVIGTRMRMASA